MYLGALKKDRKLRGRGESRRLHFANLCHVRGHFAACSREPSSQSVVPLGMIYENSRATRGLDATRSSLMYCMHETFAHTRESNTLYTAHLTLTDRSDLTDRCLSPGGILQPMATANRTTGSTSWTRGYRSAPRWVPFLIHFSFLLRTRRIRTTGEFYSPFVGPLHDVIGTLVFVCATNFFNMYFVSSL